MRKILSTLLAALIIVSCAACTPSSSSDGSTAAEGSTNSNTNDLMAPYSRYPETIEMHTAKTSSSAPNFQPGDSVDDNPMTRYILDKVNVRMVTDWEVESSEYANKLSLMLAADSLPDMFTIEPEQYLLFRQLVDNDMLADLSAPLEKTCNDFIKGTFESFNYENLDPYREGDKLYGIAGGRYGYEHNLLWVRQDWMEECGITELPRTLDDVKNILLAFKEKNPGGQNVGMLLNSQWIGGGYGSTYSADPVFEAFGATPKTWVKNKDGDVIYGSVAPEMKEGLRVLAEWYAEGLIDQQFATRQAESANALFNGGQSGLVFAPWWYSYTMAELIVRDPDAKPVPVNAPLDSEGNFNVVWPQAAGTAAVIRKDYAYPEALFKVMNCSFDMGRGIDPVAADLLQPSRDGNVDSNYLYPTAGVNFTYASIVPDVGLLTKTLIETGKEEGPDTLTEQDRRLARAAKKYADTGSPEDNAWVEYEGRYLASNIVNAPEVNIVKPAFSYMTESMADLKPNLDTLEQTTFLKIVTGELPVDAFDQFVKDWYAQGGQSITDEVRASMKQ